METKEVNTDESKVQEENKETSKVNKDEITSLKEELEKAKFDIEHWKNEYYKTFADMANLRKEIEKDHREAIKYRLEDFVDSLLGVLDAFDMAFKVKPSNPETENYLKGFEYVHKQLLSVLEAEGIQTISPNLNDKFDEKTMHAVDTVEDEGEENLIKEITFKGYKLHDHLVRAAMVVVSKHPTIKDVEEENKNEKESA